MFMKRRHSVVKCAHATKENTLGGCNCRGIGSYHTLAANVFKHPAHGPDVTAVIIDDGDGAQQEGSVMAMR